VTLDIGKKILKELHEGIYNSDNGERTLVVIATWDSYYWPSLCEDAMNLVRSRDKYQKLTPIQ